MINYRFASKAEGQRLIKENTAYYNGMTQMDIDWRLEKKGGRLDELISRAQENIQDFTEKEQAYVTLGIGAMEGMVNALGCRLPLPEEIVFIKSTQETEGQAPAYTLKNQIVLSTRLLARSISDRKEEIDMPFTRILVHEIFHIITRHSPEFRKRMYSLLGFTVMDHDIEFPQSMREKIASNPDVEHLDNYAEFTIGGVKRKCEMVACFNKSWEETAAENGSADSFLHHIQLGLVPLDNLEEYFSIDEASDFWDKVGRNTHYIWAPEECLADNFSYALTYGPCFNYKSPKLIRGILAVLQDFSS